MMRLTTACLMGVTSLALVVLGFAVKSENGASVPANSSTRATYVIGLMNYNPLLSVAFFEFKKSFGELAKENHFTVEYREVKTKATSESFRRAVDILSREDVDIIVTGQGILPFIEEKIPLKIPVVSLLTSNNKDAETAIINEANRVVFVDSNANSAVHNRLTYALKLMPQLKTLLVLHGPDEGSFSSPEAMEHLDMVAKSNAVVLVKKQFTTREELNKFFLTYDFRRIDAIFRYPDPFITANLDILFAMSQQPKIHKPLIVRNRTELEMGGLLAYGTNVENFGITAADIAYKLLTKKITVRDTPIQRPYALELGLNLSVAHSFGITIPEGFLEQCDYIVE